jgi:hypothetical protein
VSYLETPSKSVSAIGARLPTNGNDYRSWLGAAVALAIVLAVPFFLVDVPPVLDYPNHLARYFILAHPDDAILSQMYAPHWTILPNLGMDAVGAALLRATDVHVGGRILLALSLFAPVVGVVVYSRVVFGRYSYWSLASGLMAHNGAFFLGFMNFLLACGLALIGAACWIGLRRRNWMLHTIIIGATAAVLIFFCHIFGVFLFALLIGGDECARLGERYKANMLRPRDVACAAGMILAVLSPAIALYFLSPLGNGDGSVGKWSGSAKLWGIFAPFMTSNAELTLATGLVVVSLLILMRHGIKLAPGMPLVFIVLVLAFVAAPLALNGGTFVDLRLATMIGLMLFAGVQPRALPRPAIAVIGALILLRSGYIGMTWLHHRQDVADVRAAIAMVAPGTRVMVVRGKSGYLAGIEPPERALPGLYRLDGNIAALLIIERHALSPLLFANPTQQPLIVKPPFDRISQSFSELVEWPLLSEESLPAETLRNAAYLGHWRTSFDDVLLIDPVPSAQAPKGLSPVYLGPYAQLFQIDR